MLALVTFHPVRSSGSRVLLTRGRQKPPNGDRRGWDTGKLYPGAATKTQSRRQKPCRTPSPSAGQEAHSLPPSSARQDSLFRANDHFRMTYLSARSEGYLLNL